MGEVGEMMNDNDVMVLKIYYTHIPTDIFSKPGENLEWIS